MYRRKKDKIFVQPSLARLTPIVLSTTADLVTVVFARNRAVDAGRCSVRSDTIGMVLYLHYGRKSDCLIIKRRYTADDTRHGRLGHNGGVFVRISLAFVPSLVFPSIVSRYTIVQSSSDMSLSILLGKMLRTTNSHSKPDLLNESATSISHTPRTPDLRSYSPPRAPLPKMLRSPLEACRQNLQPVATATQV